MARVAATNRIANAIARTAAANRLLVRPAPANVLRLNGATPGARMTLNAFSWPANSKMGFVTTIKPADKGSSVRIFNNASDLVDNSIIFDLSQSGKQLLLDFIWFSGAAAQGYLGANRQQILPGVWQTVAVFFDWANVGSVAQYVLNHATGKFNKQIVAKTSGVATSPPAGTNWRLGTRGTDFASAFQGLMARHTIFDSIPSDAEIEAFMRNGIYPTTPPWKDYLLNEGSGTNAVDQRGVENGTYTSPAWATNDAPYRDRVAVS